MSQHPDTALALKVAELERRLNSVVTVGRVELADYPNARVKVRLNATLVTGWLRWQCGRAHDEQVWDAPEIGEQVMILSPGGELALGVVIPAISYAAYPALSDTPSKVIRQHGDGASIAYDREAHTRRIDLPADGTHVHAIDTASRTLTGTSIEDAAQQIELIAENARLELSKTAGVATLEGEIAQVTGPEGRMITDSQSTIIEHGSSRIELTDSAITFTTASGIKLVLNSEVLLGGSGASAKVARVGDSVVSGLITTGSNGVKAL